MSLPDPITRKEMYLNAAAGGNSGTLPDPLTREEVYLNAIAEGGGEECLFYATRYVTTYAAVAAAFAERKLPVVIDSVGTWIGTKNAVENTFDFYAVEKFTTQSDVTIDMFVLKNDDSWTEMSFNVPTGGRTVNPSLKASDQTQEVGIDSDGKLWTLPGGVTSVNNQTGDVTLDLHGLYVLPIGLDASLASDFMTGFTAFVTDAIQASGAAVCVTQSADASAAVTAVATAFNSGNGSETWATLTGNEYVHVSALFYGGFALDFAMPYVVTGVGKLAINCKIFVEDSRLTFTGTAVIIPSS